MLVDFAKRLRVGRVIAIVAATLVGACQTPLDSSVARGPGAYALAPASDGTVRRSEYVIRPLDTLSVTVFQEPELSLKEVKVDVAGGLPMPLVGQVAAAGRTPAALSDEIAHRLGERYLQHPQVTVTVVNAIPYRVSVEGSVNDSGVFEFQGRTSLLEAIAMAKGTTRTAALNQVVVFRTVNGQRMAALFDLGKIQKGVEADPEIHGDDKIVVGSSTLKAGWRDFLQAIGPLAIFRPTGL